MNFFESGQRQIPVESAETRAERVKSFHLHKVKEGHVGALIKVLLSDPATQEKFYRYFKDKDIILPEETPGHKDSVHKVTPLIVSIYARSSASPASRRGDA